MPRPSRSAKSSAPPPAHTRGVAIVAALACAALALWAQRRALGVWFAPDDLIALERARGLAPPYPVPFWRVLSGSGYFAVASRMFGANPFPYHVVTWLAHALNATLLFALARRWSRSSAVALVAAGLFAASRTYATALLQCVGAEEVFALTGVLLAFLAVRPGRPRTLVLAALLFAAALLCKEIVLLTPLVLAFPLAPDTPLRARAAAAGVLLGVSALFLAAFVAAHGGLGVSGGDAYATAYGANLPRNLSAFTAWLTDFRHASPDAVAPAGAWASALVALALAGLAAAAGPRWPLVAAGAAWWVLALAPVLPYLHHTYLFYAYDALPGMTLAVAGGLGGAWRRIAATRPTPPSRARAAWAGAILLVAAHALASDRLAAERWATLYPGVELHLDPVLRKSELARNASATLGASVSGPHARVVLVRPGESTQMLSAQGLGQHVSSDQPDLFASVLDQGRALRALHPEIDSIAFVPRWTPGYRDFDLAINSADGGITNFGRGPQAHVMLVSALMSSGLDSLALEHLATVMPLFPDDPDLRDVLARVEALQPAPGAGRSTPGSR